MPSIFIWKADTTNTSKKYIIIYSGSNWILEQHDNISKSYKYIEQIVIPGFNDSVITFNAQIMPTDWIGSELLEVTKIPYRLIKSDKYGTLEHIGEWFYFTLTKKLDYTKDNMIRELDTIKFWISTESNYSKSNFSQSKKSYSEGKQSDKNNTRYDNTTINVNNTHNVLDPDKIHNDFKKFLDKYNIHKINNIY